MAKTYQKILLAVDFHDDNVAVIESAKSIAEKYSAKLFLVHVIEALGMISEADWIYWGNDIKKIETDFRTGANRRLKELAEEHGMDEADCRVLEGRPALRIHEFCIENSIDLVVLGSHGKHGLQLMLGSTASSVLHNSVCDVLAVRIKRE